MLDLAEEAALADPSGPFRRIRPDGTIADLSSYDSDGVILVFTDGADGTRVFIDFVLA